MNKKYLICAATIMTAAALIAGCGSSTTSENTTKNTFTIGLEPTFPPFEFSDNDTFKGFDLDLSQAIADKLGEKLEVKSMGFDALIPALKSGQIDMIASGMDATPERSKQVDFTKPYFHDGYVVVVRKDDNSISGFDGLAGKTVGSQVGTQGVDLAQAAGATVKQYDANSQGWMELNNKTCDAVIINKSVALYYLQQGASKDLKIAGDAKLAPDPVALALKKGNKEQLEKVNKALDELKADGTYAKLYKKWFGTEPPKE